MTTSETLIDDSELEIAPNDLPDPETAASEAEARSRRLRAWADAGATTVPALLIALGGAAFGGLAMLIRRRRRR